MKNKNEFDFVIIGGGIVGLSVANQLHVHDKNLKIAVVEKESRVAAHASGRNSGVIHAGFYYTPDSLKAKLTRDGNLLLHEFCKINEIPVLTTGKVVVTQSEIELDTLDELYRRGIENRVPLEMISESDLKKIEPIAKTSVRALWSPSTSVADPSQVVEKMAELFVKNGGYLLLGQAAEVSLEGELLVGQEKYTYKHLINSSGLYSDRIAKNFGFAQSYVMLPFIGLYFYAPKLKGLLNSHIYPVPDPRNPFLGVHLTKTIKGETKIGPTAIPIISREQYSAFGNLKFDEVKEIFKVYPKFLFSEHHDVLGLLKTELPKLSKKHLSKKAVKLTKNLDPREFNLRGKPGIRAQLFDLQKSKLEMDFVIQGDSRSTHLLNAVSPAWTSSISFAKFVIDDLKSRQVL